MADVVHERAIGLARCPLPRCGSRKASLRLSTRGLAYLLCNACNCQIFARSERSDDGLRELQVMAAPEPEPADPAPAPIAPPEPPTNIAPPVDQAETARLVKIGFF
jgi:hypothetical protein